ncbi:hypothetical protein [uncultured Anaerococcus sp.]|uniref:hypothetical protein n=1 Tax=uncultured Anaerococcus sp. TaxID=293428 RepID=UPI00288A7859|nr:hypothetical protein [uncultured Anaerococcus sp.]
MKKYMGFENLKKYYNKKIKVFTKNNEIFIGKFTLHTKPGDNDPEIESISLETPERYYDINTTDIIKIEILD